MSCSQYSSSSTALHSFQLLTGWNYKWMFYRLETKAITTSSHCNTGRTYLSLRVTTRENTSLAIHVVQKITIIGAQKVGKCAIWNWYSVVAPSGSAERNLNMGAQLHIIHYKNPPKHFLELHGLIDFRCAQTLALPCAFGTTGTNLTVLRATL